MFFLTLSAGEKGDAGIDGRDGSPGVQGEKGNDSFHFTSLTANFMFISFLETCLQVIRVGSACAD